MRELSVAEQRYQAVLAVSGDGLAVGTAPGLVDSLMCPGLHGVDDVPVVRQLQPRGAGCR